MDPCGTYTYMKQNPALVNTKRFSRQKKWDRPEKTETDLINEDKDKINEKLQNYLEAPNIDMVSINTHVRYFIFDTRLEEPNYVFRLGGLLAKKDTKFVVFSNGNLSWSVPKETEHKGKIYPTKFWRIMTPIEMEANRADKIRVEKDQQMLIASQQQDEIERQKAEIEKLKKLIVKMDSKSQLTSDNQSTIYSAKKNVKSIR